LIDAEDLGVIVSAKDYYNTVRKERFNKAKSKTIITLLRMLKDNELIYRTRVSIEKSVTGISRKFIQLFWAYRKQLEAAQRFVAGWLIVIDGTFNTNELRLPLLIIINMFNANKTFLVAFFFCPFKSAEFISFI
jgi:hypothetical protein